MVSEQFWDDTRDPDGTINLEHAFYKFYAHLPEGKAREYLLEVEKLRPVKSRQVAASVLAMAFNLERMERIQ